MSLWVGTTYTYVYYMTGIVSSLAIWIKVLGDLNRHSDDKLIPDLPVPPELVMFGTLINTILWPITTPLFLAAWLSKKR